MMTQRNFSIATELTKFTFPFLLFVSLSSLLSGILNTNNKFAAAAAAPIVLNIVLILSLIISFYLDLNFAKNLSIGVTLGRNYTIDYSSGSYKNFISHQLK